MPNVGVVWSEPTWVPAPVDVAAEMWEELVLLFRRLPDAVAQALHNRFTRTRLEQLAELYIQRGRRPEAVFCDEQGNKQREFIVEGIITENDLRLFIDLFHERYDTEGPAKARPKRAGIDGTLHRLSVITHPSKPGAPVLGITARIGRVIYGLVECMAPVLLHPRAASLLLIGRPGVGKTTVLRELARLLSDQVNLNVVVVDKSCEIAGDGLEPHKAIGSARWMPVGIPDHQASIMREAVENQSPDVVIVDEISTAEEVAAARTIAQRGVRLIASVHGVTLPDISNCKERGALVGGQHTVTVSGREADLRADKQKSVQKRLRDPVFLTAVELHERERWVYHPDVKGAMDFYFDHLPVECEELTPGRATRTRAVRVECGFDYCDDCQVGRRCAAHKLSYTGGGGEGAYDFDQNREFGGYGGRRGGDRRRGGRGGGAGSSSNPFDRVPTAPSLRNQW
eukprot:TRINITY_DN13512_c0_g1_i1.p1 TRINITY_DN13512_c0_g1~~TRINITY_DN13512_c0_g1_i1.p1  ORF type:complete len:455 (+),score=95.47 TRINITY_DN13512_c0_g1_i1:170-1534(+)